MIRKAIGYMYDQLAIWLGGIELPKGPFRFLPSWYLPSHGGFVPKEIEHPGAMLVGGGILVEWHRKTSQLDPRPESEVDFAGIRNVPFGPEMVLDGESKQAFRLPGTAP